MRIIRNKTMLIVAFAIALSFFTGCSRIANFVVANATDQSIVVSYKLKVPADPEVWTPREAPMVRPLSELDMQTSWSSLSPSAYTIDRESRTVTVPIGPKEVVRIE